MAFQKCMVAWILVPFKHHVNYIPKFLFPQDTVYEYHVDIKQHTWASWEDKLRSGWRYNPRLVVAALQTILLYALEEANNSAFYICFCCTKLLYNVNNYIFSEPFYKITVPTVDTVRYDFLVYNLIKAHRPVLLTGPVGTGKTSVAQGVLSRLDPKSYSILTINMSAQVMY